MSRLDLSRRRSRKMVARARRDYGENLRGKAVYEMLARLVAIRGSATKAYLEFHPSAGLNTARTEASRLMAHPDMNAMVRENIAAGYGQWPASAAEMAELRDLLRRAFGETA